MRCIFCKCDSSETKSIEHIVPESLGNKSFVLPRGYVCDKCNNYFSREVERPFLERQSMGLLRFEEAIPNKKKRIPKIKGVMGSEEIEIEKKMVNGEIVMGIGMPAELILQLFLDQDNMQESFTLSVPAYSENDLPPQDSITSRFLAKIAVEALSIRIEDEEWVNNITDDSQFDPIRNHARMGTTRNWPCSIRRIYETDKLWNMDSGEVQKVFECDFLLPSYEKTMLNGGNLKSECYFVIALWGIEFAINIGGPEIEGYQDWLKEHDGNSPLYYGKNEG